MKVGLIGLGRMGEGMSRRMMKQGIEVYGYRRNFAKAQEAADNGYITAAADSLESLVQVVKRAESIYGEKSGETVYVKSESRKPHGPYLADAYADVDEEEEEYGDRTDYR